MAQNIRTAARKPPGMLMTAAEVADDLRISRSQVFILIKSGDLPSVLIGPKIRRVVRAGVEEYIKRLKAEAEAALAAAGHDAAQPGQKAS